MVLPQSSPLPPGKGGPTMMQAYRGQGRPSHAGGDALGQAGPRILIVMRRVPTHARVGNTAVLVALAEALRGKGARVDLLVVSARAFGRRPVERIDLPAGSFDRLHCAEALRLGRWVVAARPGPWIGALGAFAGRILRGGRGSPGVWPATLPVTAGEIATVEAELAREPCRAVIADYVFLAPLARLAMAHGARGVVYLHDLMSQRHRRFVEQGRAPDVPAMTLDEEVGLIGGLDAAVAIQEEEARQLAAHPAAPPVLVASMPRRAVRVAQAAADPDRLVFVGSDNPANVDALEWFLGDVWPHLQARRPNVRLDVVGAIGAAFPDLPWGVERHGAVADLAPYLSRAALAIAPQRIGSGLNVKLLDYLAHGLPVVASPLARAGLKEEAAACVLEAADGEAFAAGIEGLLADDGKRAACRAAAFAYIERHHSPEAVYQGLFRVIGLDRRPVPSAVAGD